jgi:hypothetical protein
VAEADADYRKATDGENTRQKSQQKDQTEAILQVSGEWKNHPVEDVMQEHRQLIKRASAEAERQLDSASTNFENTLILLRKH